MMMPRSESESLTMEKCAHPDNKYWDIKGLSVYLNVKVKTLYTMVPEIPHYRVRTLIRFRKQEIELWMESNRVIPLCHCDSLVNQKGRQSAKGKTDIDRLVKKAIDLTKQEIYNPDHGKSDRIEGP